MAKAILAIKREIFYKQGIAYRATGTKRWRDYLAYNDGRQI